MTALQPMSSMWTDPRTQSFGPGLPPVQTLGGSMFTDPQQNPAYMNSPAAIDAEYARNHQQSHGFNPAGLPGHGTGSFFGGAPQQSQALPALQPPAFDWHMIQNLLGTPSVGTSGTPTYSSNITAGPIFTPQQTQAATTAIGSAGGGNLPLLPGMAASGAQGASVNTQAADAGHPQATQAATDFSRSAAAANAHQQLQSQQARAQQGVQLADFLATIQGNNFTAQQRQRALLQTLLGHIGPMIGMG